MSTLSAVIVIHGATPHAFSEVSDRVMSQGAVRIAENAFMLGTKQSAIDLCTELRRDITRECSVQIATLELEAESVRS